MLIDTMDVKLYNDNDWGSILLYTLLVKGVKVEASTCFALCECITINRNTSFAAVATVDAF